MEANLSSDEELRVLTCVALSRAVYASSIDQMVLMLNNELQPYNHGLSEVILSNNCKQQYAIGLKHETKEMFVAFRGTTNVADIFVDLRILGLPNSPYGCFHDGFSSRAALVHVAPFAQFLEQQPGWKLVVTGHSLGGAVATIVATIFLGDPRIREKTEVFCVTFGSPLCCDKNAAKFFEQRHANNFSHFVNDEDIVPRLLSLTETMRANLFASKKTNNEYLAQQLGAVATKEFEAIFSSQEKSSWFSQNVGASSIVRFLLDNDIVKSTIAPCFTPMGKVYRLFVQIQKDVCADHLITTHIRSTHRIPPQHIPTFYTYDLRAKKENILLFMQDHAMDRYSEELWSRIPNKGSKILSMRASPSSHLAQYFHLSASSLINDVPENEEQKGVPLYWSVVRTPLKDFEEIQLVLHGSLAPLVVGVSVEGTAHVENLAKPQSMSADSCRSFQLFIPLEPSKPRPAEYMIDIFGHFNHITARFQASKFANAIELKGRLHQISALDQFELYKLAFTFSLFTDQRALAPTVEGAGYNYQAKVLQLLLRIQSRFTEQCDELVKDPTFIKHAVREIEQVALGRQLDAEKFEFDQKEVGALIVEPASPTPALTSISLVPLQQVQQQWQEGKLQHSTDAILLAAPGLLATSLSIFKQLEHAANSQKKRDILRGVAVAGGFLLLFVGGPFLLASLPWISGAMVGGAAGAAVATYTVVSLIKSLSEQYLQMLREWALSLGLHPARIRNDPYYLEQAIHTMYNKKFRPVTHANIIQHWDKYFPCGSLRIVATSCQEYCLRVLETISDNYQLRELLAADIGLGVIGPGKSGKSTLLNVMLKCGSNPDPSIRTTDLATFRIHQRFYAVDFPHLTASLDNLKLCYSANHSLVHCVVVVLSALQGGDDAAGEKYVVEVAKRFAAEGTKILYCFNGADFLLPFRHGRRKKANLIASNSGRNQVEVEKADPVTASSVQARLARYAQNYKLPLADCLMTAFDPYPDEDDTTPEYEARVAQLRELGVQSTSYIKQKWLARVLEECGMGADDIAEIVRDAPSEYE